MRRIFIISCIIVITLVAAGASIFGAQHLLFANAASQTTQAKTENMYITLYGPPSNTPPGNGISSPVIHHNGADGNGTFNNPTTFATDKNELKPGTKVYVSYLKRYFIMEDTCDTCTQDFNKQPPRLHINLWVGSQGQASDSAVTDCENSLIRDQAPVIVSPANNLQVISGPLFNPSAGCFKPGSSSGSPSGSTPAPKPPPSGSDASSSGGSPSGSTSNPNPPPSSSSSSPYVKSGDGKQANVPVGLTWYAYKDNSGQTETQYSSADIAYPKSGGNPTLHNLATEGKGTFNDPITFAARNNDQKTFPIGSVIYVPLTHKYYVMEDQCGDTNGCMQGPAPDHHHVDLWMGPDKPDNTDSCENNNTPGNSNVVINPKPDLPVETTPEFSNGKCTLKTFPS